LGRHSHGFAFASCPTARRPNAHIVPATYLRNFAVDGNIGVYLVHERRKFVRAVEQLVGQTNGLRTGESKPNLT
jgi:hypothetical protein